MTTPIWMASPPEMHSALLSSGPGPGSVLAAAGAWSSLSAEYASAAEDLNGLLGAVQAGAWQGPSAERYVAAHVPYLAWLTQAGTNSAVLAAQHETVAAAYTAAVAVMPTLGELGANHTVHGALMATNFFGMNTIPIALNEADYERMWIQAATTMTTYQAVSDTAVAATPQSAPAPQILNWDPDQGTVNGLPYDSYTDPSQPIYWKVRALELSQDLQTFLHDLQTNPLQALSYLVQLMLFDWPTHIAQIVTWLGQSPLLLSAALGLAVANLGFVAGLAGLAGLAQAVPAPVGPVPQPLAAEPKVLPAAGMAPSAPAAAAPAAPAPTTAPAPGAPAGAAPSVATPAGVEGFGYLAGGGGPGTTFGPTMRSRSGAEATASDTAAAPSAATAVASAREQARARRRRRAAAKGFGDEYMDMDSDPGAPLEDELVTSAVASDQGAGPLGFAGTTRKADVTQAAGLATLGGDSFGGGPTAPMVPGTWVGDPELPDHPEEAGSDT